MARSYNELNELSTIQERFDYLQMNGTIGIQTFGHDRYIDQAFYKSPQWRKARANAIVRDNGNDLGVDGYQIHDRIIVHHINPITKQQIEDRDPILFDLNNLICVSDATHRALHYGGQNPNKPLIERRPGDTCPWK